MSDLNDLIATNAINSFNSGVQTGIAQERERIIELLERKDYRGNGPTFTLIELKRLIKGEQK